MTHSISEINTFNKCQYLWQMRYLEGVEEGRISERMEGGRLVHLYINRRLQGMSSDEASDGLRGVQMVTTDGEILALGPGEETLLVAERAYQEVTRNWTPISVDGKPATEYRVTSRKPRMVGYVDLIGIDHEGSTWVIDYKLRSNLQSDEWEDYSLQLALYQLLLRREGLDVVGSAVLQIKDALPSRPKRNKDGSASRADILTDWETYQACLVEWGLDPDAYDDMRQKLQGKTFFRVSKTYRSMETLEAQWEVIVSNLKSIEGAKRTAKKRTLPRNMHPVNCKLCSHRDECMNRLYGFEEVSR